MVRRFTRALLLSPLALLFALGLASCADDDPVAPEATGVDPAEEIVDPPAPVPETAPASSSTPFRSSDRCRLPLGDHGRYQRVLTTSTPGDFPLDAASGWSACGDAPDDSGNHFSWSEDENGVAWSASVPVGGVVLWSGQDAVLHEYATRSRGDSGLSGPVDPATGVALPIDGITLCHDYAVGLDLALETTGGASVQWEVTADVSPPTWELLPGDRATSRAVLDLQRVEGEGGARQVDVDVVISNPTPIDAIVSSVYALIGTRLSFAILSAPLPITLGPGEAVTAHFAAELAEGDPSDVMVVVSTGGIVGGGRVDTAVPTDAADGTIELVTDDGQRLGPFDASQTVTVERTVAAEALGPGTTTVPWTFGRDDGTEPLAVATISVTVHEPGIETSMTPRFTRTWDWSLAVSSTGELLPDAFGPQVGLRIEATPVAAPDTDFGVGGAIDLFNAHPARDLVVDALSVEVGGAVVDVPIEGSVPAAGRLTVPVDLALAGPVSTATVRLDVAGRALRWDDETTAADVVSRNRSATLAFDVPTTTVDATARVSDSNTGALGPVAASAGTTVLETSVALDPLAPCGPVTVDGRVELVGSDRRIAVTRDYAFAVDVPCEDDGCTRTVRSWRRHLGDPVWDELPDGRATALFGSGYTWEDVLRPRTRGGPYKRLAAQYVAARLNAMAGADVSAAHDAMVAAGALLRDHDPRSLRGRDAARAVRLTWTLRRFNAGKTGPGPCAD